MELFTAIALLCQISAGGEKGLVGYVYHQVDRQQLDCQQYYTHCVNTKTTMTQTEAMTKCVMERTL